MAAMFFSSSFFYLLTICILISAPSCLTKTDFHKTTKQKITHLHFYWHDIRGGSAPTSVPIVKIAPYTTSEFGTVVMIDDRLTSGPKLSSKEVGRAQGFYAWASQEEFSACMNINYVFTYGKYNGSTITIMGSNPTLQPVRELPVIGGTGLFRFARGYAKIRTLDFNPANYDVMVEYNVTILHY